MAHQLTFDLPVKVSRDRGNFFVSEANRLAVARLDAPEIWPNGKLVLTGPTGAGKSHLARIWAEDRETEPMTPADLEGLDIPGIDGPRAIEIDGRLSAREEELVFHLHNHMAASGLPLLFVARDAPARWSIALPDLRSRLEATDIVRIDEPDDALLSAVVLKLFSDRQVQVSPRLVAWLIARIDRSFESAQRVVAQLDAAALAAKKPVTRDFARRVLDKPHGNAP